MRLILTLVLLTLATPALADNQPPPADGVHKINQTCAERKGCFAGDTPGLPVTITAPGSYRLTSNLNVPDMDTDGIHVNAHDVGIDLNNFAIIGPVTCSTATSDDPAICPAKGTGTGIKGTFSGNFDFDGTSVKNGSIRGMGGNGLFLYEHAEVTNVRASWNAANGISVNQGSVISGNTASENGQHGIHAPGCTIIGNTTLQNSWTGMFPGRSTVTGNISSSNGREGIRVDGGATVSGNTVRGNGSYGIDDDQQGGTVVSGNAVTSNGSAGIRVGSGSNVSGNSSHGNRGYGISATSCGGCIIAGNSVAHNDRSGILVGGRARVSGNSVYFNGASINGGYGIEVNDDSTYSENTITDNRTGAVNGSGVNMGDNYCAGPGVTAFSCP